MNSPVLVRFLPVVIDGRVRALRVSDSTYQAMIFAIKKQQAAARRAWGRLGKLGRVWKRRRRK